ncbi:MAG: flagellar hook-basal body complex protein FliE [Bacillota bacterium]
MLDRVTISTRPAFTLPGRDAAVNNPPQGSFRATFMGALAEVNRLQLQADELNRQLATGQISDIHRVTIATEKATLALELTVQIRNRIIEAYQEIMRMQL